MTDKQRQIDHAHNFFQTVFAAGDIVEIRGLWDGGSVSALFDNHYIAARYAVWLNDQGVNVYYTLNPIRRDSRTARSHVLNMPKLRSFRAARDEDIARVTCLVVDIDSIHPKGLCATTEEKSHTTSVADQVGAYLTDKGFPIPIRLDTGNGVHLIYAVESGYDPLDGKLLLNHLADRFDSPHVSIDRAVWNASRVLRAPGCRNRKGNPTEDRPHRLARVLVYPEVLDPVSITPLRKLAYEGLQSRPKDPTGTFTVVIDKDGVDQLFDEYPEQLSLVKETHIGDQIWFGLEECPFKGAPHQGQRVGRGKSALVLSPDYFGFKCFSSDCQDHGIGDLKRLLHDQTGRWPSMAFYEDDFDWNAAFAKLGVEDADPEYVVADEDEETTVTAAELCVDLGIERVSHVDLDPARR